MTLVLKVKKKHLGIIFGVNLAIRVNFFRITLEELNNNIQSGKQVVVEKKDYEEKMELIKNLQQDLVPTLKNIKEEILDVITENLSFLIIFNFWPNN